MIEFIVPGIPATAGSKTGFYNKKLGRVMTVNANKKQKPWMAVVSAYARQAYSGNLLTGAIRMTLAFAILRPKYHYRTNGELNPKKARKCPIVKPDGGKMQRAVEDALTGIIWRDDSQVAVWTGSKVYVDRDPGVLVTIEEIEK